MWFGRGGVLEGLSLRHRPKMSNPPVVAVHCHGLHDLVMDMDDDGGDPLAARPLGPAYLPVSPTR